MNELTLLITLIIASAFLCLFIGALTTYRQGKEESLVFLLLMTSCAVYALHYAFELVWANRKWIHWIVKIRFTFLVIIPLLWLLFTLNYANQKKFLRFRIIALLSILPTAMIALVWTNESHQLFITSSRLYSDSPIPILQLQFGPLYYFGLLYALVFLLIGVFIIIADNLEKEYKRLERMILFLFAILVPALANLFVLKKTIPWDISLIGPSFALSSVFLYLSLYRFNTFNLAPVARELVVEAMRDGVLVLDKKDRLVDANTAGRRLLKAALEADFDSGLSFLPFPERNLGKPVDFSLLMDGSERRFHAEALSIPSKRRGKVGTIITITDNTEVSMLVDRLAHLATTDELTGLDNRRRFMEWAQHEVDLARRSGRSFSILMIDIDRFKSINDRFGHAAGDEVLKEVANRCRSPLRSIDLICRYGGEEFAVLLADTDPESALEIAERLRLKVCSEPSFIGTTPIDTSISIGIATAKPDEKEDLETLLRYADEAMYAAKESGRNAVISYNSKSAATATKKN